AQRVQSGRIEQQPSLERLRRYLGSHRLAERERLEQAAAAHLAKSVSFRKLGKQSRECFSFLFDAIDKILLRHLGEHGETRGTHHRVAVECAALVAMRKAARGFCREQRRKGYTAPQAFTEGQDVGLDPHMLVVEQLPGAPDTRLDLIEDQ